MKKSLYLIGVLAAILCSCTNLDEEIYSSIPKDRFFTSEEQFVKYSARAYSSLQDWGTEQSLWTLNLQLTNEIVVPRNPTGEWSQSRYEELQFHKPTASNNLLNMGWEFCFKGITACNDVLDTVESTSEFPGRNKIIAEMKVLRAYFYYMAVSDWGNVPYSISKKETQLPQQKDRAFMFNFIESDIKENLQYLSKERSAETYGRITQGVAYCLLAKLYLNAEQWIGVEKWTEAEACCDSVMKSGQYQILNNYKDNFAINNENTAEGIFAIPYSTIYTKSDHNAFVIYMLTLPANMVKPVSASPDTKPQPVYNLSWNINAAPWDGFVADPDFFASYDPADTRKADTWIYGQLKDLAGNDLTIDLGDGPVPFVLDAAMDESVYTNRRTPLQGARIGKWPYQSDGLLTGDQVSMDNDFYLMRYADVVLMRAEALVRLNRAAEAAALTDLQKIRTRAGLAPLTAADLTLDNIYLERMHELALEGWQREDMIRFGKYLGSWWNKPVTTENDLLLPIPSPVLSANPNLTQNPR